MTYWLKNTDTQRNENNGVTVFKLSSKFELSRVILQLQIFELIKDHMLLIRNNCIIIYLLSPSLNRMCRVFKYRLHSDLLGVLGVTRATSTATGQWWEKCKLIHSLFTSFFLNTYCCQSSNYFSLTYLTVKF